MADATYDVVTALGGIVSEGVIESRGAISTRGNILAEGRISGNGAVPVGTVLAHAGQKVPLGFLECNGDSITIDEYPELYGEVGVEFGYSGSFVERTVTSVSVSSDQDLTNIRELVPFGTGNDDQVPVLTADSASVIASGSHSGKEKWRAFDGNILSIWESDISDNPCYLGYNFGTGKIITGYSLRCLAIVDSGKYTPEINPKSWVLEGSNDASTWVELHSVSDFDFSMDMPSGGALFKRRIKYETPNEHIRHKTMRGGYVYSKWRIENTVSYQYYRLNISEASWGDNVHISDFALMSGDFIDSSAANIIDGVRTTIWSSESNPTTDQTVILDCGSSVAANSYKMCGQYTEDTMNHAPGQWVLAGSDDGSTWTTLHAVNCETFSTHDSDIFYLFENSTAFRCYRFTFSKEYIDGRVVLHGIQLSIPL